MKWTEPVLLEHALTHGQGGHQKILVRMGFPRWIDNYKWACAFQLVGRRKDKIFTAVGGDAVQALTIAASAIRSWLDKLQNLSSDPVPYEYIFPRYVPISYGLDFHRYLCDVLDKEINKKEKELTKKRLSRKRRE
jgi:Domain of unknown function (DUF6968)